MYRLVALCVLVLTATATDAAAAEQLRPPPGTPDPKLMALVAADLGGARVTAQHYYKDRDFSSTISYSREFEDGRVGSTALVYVDSEVEMGTSAQVSATYVSTLRSVLGTKKGRAAFVNAFSSDELVSKPTLGRPRRLGVGSDSVDVPLTFRILGVKTEAHFAVFAVDQALGTVILIGVPGRHAPLAVVTRLARIVTTRMTAELTPRNIVLPSLSGTPQAGSTLAATPGTWSGTVTAFTYQWQRCDGAGGNCVDLPSSCVPDGSFCTTPALVTGPTYMATWFDASWAGTIRVAVTAHGTSTAVTVYSLPSAPVAAAPRERWPTNILLPAISGTLHAGQTLIATAGTWTAGASSFVYIWQRCDTTSQPSCRPVGVDGRAPTYVLAPADLGSALTVCVIAYNAAGAGGACSARTAEIS